MLRNEWSSIVDLICHLRWLKTPGSPAHVNVSPPRPCEDLIQLSVSVQRTLWMAFWSQMTSAMGLLVSDFTRVAYKNKTKQKKSRQMKVKI